MFTVIQTVPARRRKLPWLCLVFEIFILVFLTVNKGASSFLWLVPKFDSVYFFGLEFPGQRRNPKMYVRKIRVTLYKDVKNAYTIKNVKLRRIMVEIYV